MCARCTSTVQTCRTCPKLRALTKLQDITLSHCTRRELLIPLHKSSLTRVTLVDCDLRGDFFHSFDRERAITSLTLIRCELDSTSGLDGFTGLTELTLRDVSGALDWSALGSLPLQTVTTDALRPTPSAPPARLPPSRSRTERRFPHTKRKTPLPERTNRQGCFHRRNGVGKRNYHVAWRICVVVGALQKSCAVTKNCTCYLTVPII